MANLIASEVISRLLTVQSVDDGRVAGSPYKLPTSLRNDVNGDLTELMASEVDTAPREGARAGASGAKRVALVELERQVRGGFRGIAALDEATLTEPQRLQVFESYGWEGGELGLFTDARVVSLARQAATVTAGEVGGDATRLYTAARLARIAAQLAIVDALESTASGADRQAATLRRDSALGLASMTLLRVRFFYCSATRDGDATPELVRIGYQPRRAPGDAGDGGGDGGGGTVPATPTNVTYTQENPGDAVAAGADAVADTIARIYARLVGETGDAVLVASAALLPTSFILGPGDWELTMTYGNAAGESAPSAPVVLTVA